MSIPNIYAETEADLMLEAVKRLDQSNPAPMKISNAPAGNQ